MREQAEGEQRQIAQPSDGVDRVRRSDKSDQSLAHTQEDSRTEDHGEEGQEVGGRIQRYVLDDGRRHEDHHGHYQHGNDLDGQPAEHDGPGRCRRDPEALKDPQLAIPGNGRGVAKDGNRRDTEGESQRHVDDWAAELSAALAGGQAVEEDERQKERQHQCSTVSQLDGKVRLKQSSEDP